MSEAVENGDSVSITASVPLDGGGKGAAAAAPAVDGGKPAAGDGSAAADAPGGAAPAAAGDAPANGAPPVNPNELTKKPEEPAKDPEQVRAEAATGLDLNPFTQEFHENGKLSDESYAKLAEKGFTREITDTYIAGVQAKATLHLTSIATAVGGTDNYNAILEWGKGALSETEKAQTVKMLSGDAEVAKTYLVGLQARYHAAEGKVPGKIAGGGGAPTADVFADRSEQAKAMKDPRYKTDPEFRQKVIDKSVRSFSKASKGRTKKGHSSARRARTSTTRRAKR